MTTGLVYISEYHTSMSQGVQAPRAPAIVVQTPILSGALSQSSQPFVGTLVRIAVDGGGPVNVKWGSPSVVAVAQFDEHLAANQTEWRNVTPNDVVAIIASTA